MKMKRSFLASTLVLSFMIASTAWATVIDMTAPGGGSGEINGAFYVEASIAPTGSGVIDSFVRINPGGNQPFEQGYNTGFRKLQYDENTSPTFTRDLPLSSVPIVVANGTNIPGATSGVAYREFILDINETNSADGDLLSLRRVIIFLRSDGLLDAATATENLPYSGAANALFPDGNLVYDSGGGANQVWMRFDENAGSGKGDVFMYVPDSLFTGGTFVYLYSEFGGFSGPTGANFSGLVVAGSPAPLAVGLGLANNVLTSDDGFEEWAVRTPGGLPPPETVPEPTTMILLGSGLLGLWGARKKFRK